jgi:hypothetical protein
MATINRVAKVKFILLFMFAALAATAQTNLVNVTNGASGVSPSASQSLQSQTNPIPSFAERLQQIRAACIQSRRCICGKILKILPEGLVVESGYTNLLRTPLNRSWLVPGSVTSNRATGLIEDKEPGSVCIGLVLVTDLPKSRRLKPKLYDYVIIEGYPSGRYTYTSVGNVQRTVRKFSAKLENSVNWNLQNEDKSRTPTADVK